MGKINGEITLMNFAKQCFICGGVCLQKIKSDYLQCECCGHEILGSSDQQEYIINDQLIENSVYRLSALDRFKAETLALFDNNIERSLLLDIGSASGKFLFHNGSRYIQAIGIEVTIESIKFSKEKLNLNIVENISDIKSKVSFATAWHSLEHIPVQYLLELLRELALRLDKGGRIIVSVPNGKSRQYQWFGKSYAYYDTPNHLHQFTPQSLTLLMKQFDLIHIADIPSWNYNVFGYIQALLNVTTRTHNYMYYRLKRRSIRPSIGQDILNVLLLLVFVPIGWLLGVLDSLDLKQQGVITACFEKKIY
jgi:SAM-dependent methyltransferase